MVFWPIISPVCCRKKESKVFFICLSYNGATARFSAMESVLNMVVHLLLQLRMHFFLRDRQKINTVNGPLRSSDSVPVDFLEN